MMRRHGKVENHGHGIEGRMTSTKKYLSVGNQKKREKPTEAECPNDEKERSDGNEERSRSSCEFLSPALDTFKTGKDKARAATGHGALIEGMGLISNYSS
jgi:hypothetical protein